MMMMIEQVEGKDCMVVCVTASECLLLFIWMSSGGFLCVKLVSFRDSVCI
jgi:hypothetical protein